MVLFFLFSAFAADYYADPVNGTASGDGSAANPWVSLEQVIADGHFETQGWDALPYVAGQSVLVATSNGTISPGDTLWLRSGYHGDAVLQGLYNAGPITIAAEAGHTPTLSHLLVRGGANWTFRGLTLSPSLAPIYSTQTVVEFDSHNFHGPVYDCIIEDSEVFSEADISTWTADDWNSRSADGMQVDGDRMTVRNNWVHNVDFGITVNAVTSQIDHNTVENFAGDALRGLGDYTTFEYNLVRNSYDVNENHDDGFQSWAVGPDGVGTGAVTGIVLRGNVIVNFTDPNQPLRGPLQGIALFDGFFDDWVIENNVVVVDHWHGISVYGARNANVVNNTVVDLSEGEPGATWIRINPHKDGTPSSGNLIRNNLANTYAYDASETDFDHNLQVPFADYSLHFVDFPNDLRLLPNSTAVDAGSDLGAPALDADEASRPVGSSVDQGAYEYGAEAPNPGTETGTETNGGTTPTETGTGGTTTDTTQSDPSGTAETGGCACDQTGAPTAGWLGLWLFMMFRRATR